MINSTKDLILEFIAQREEPFKRVLDVGSKDEGGTLRGLFDSKVTEYVGLDMRAGGNVDVILNAHDIKKHFEPESFDLVMCFDTLEHDDQFWVTAENLKWVLKKGGLLVVGVPSRRCPLHRHPRDYWRFMPDGVEALFADLAEFKMRVDEFEDIENEIYAWGTKA